MDVARSHVVLWGREMSFRRNVNITDKGYKKIKDFEFKKDRIFSFNKERKLLSGKLQNC